MNTLVTHTLTSLLTRASSAASASQTAREPGHARAPQNGWDAETGPAVFRSEGFAEDLDDTYAAH